MLQSCSLSGGRIPLSSDTITAKLDRLATLKSEAQAADREAKEKKRAADDFQAALYAEMRELGLFSARTSEGNFSLKSTVYAKVQDHDAFIAWVREQGMEEEYLREKEVAQRLNEYVRDAVDNGTELPPGVTWYPREYISVTKD